MRQTVRLKIYAEWQTDARQWVATSSDIRGLAAEAGSLAALEDRLEQILPELMQAHGLDGQAALIVNGAV